MAGGVIRSVPSEPKPDFFSTLERAIVHSIRPLAVVVCSVQSHAYVADLDFYKELVPSRRSGIFVLDLAMPGHFTTTRRPRCCRCRVRWIPRPIHLDVEDLLDAGLAHGLSVGNGASPPRAGDPSRLRRLHAGAGGGDRRLNGPDDCIHDARDLQGRRDVRWNPSRAGWEVRRRAPRCSPGRRSRSRSKPRQRRVLDHPGREGRGRGVARTGFGERGGPCAHRLWNEQ